MHVFVSNFLGYVSAKNKHNRINADNDVTKIKTVTFSETQDRRFTLHTYDTRIIRTQDSKIYHTCELNYGLRRYLVDIIVSNS